MSMKSAFFDGGLANRIFKPFKLSYSAGGLFLAFFALALGLKPGIVFSGFTQSAIWTLIPALFFGFTLQKTGLGKRIALAISPLVWLFVFVMAGNSFIIAYQNMWAMMSRSIAGERAFTNKHLGTYGIIYFAACFIALLIAIPMWMNAGLFG